MSQDILKIKFFKNLGPAILTQKSNLKKKSLFRFEILILFHCDKRSIHLSLFLHGVTFHVTCQSICFCSHVVGIRSGVLYGISNRKSPLIFEFDKHSEIQEEIQISVDV